MIPVSANAAALMGTAARLLVAAYLVTMMFSMGLALGDEQEDRQARRRQRRLLVRALVFNLALLPLVAFVITRLLRPSNDAESALLLLAASAGGRFAPQLASAAHADRGLSVEIALFLVKLVPFTAPLVVRWTLGLHHVELHELPMIAKLLALQFLPYVAGKWVRRHRGRLADGLTRPVRVVSAIALAAIVAFVLFRRELRALWLLSGRDWLAVLACAAASLALGWLLGGSTPATRRAFAISANSRNLGLALMLANLAFADGHMQLPTFAVWVVFLGFNYGFITLVGREERLPQATAR